MKTMKNGTRSFAIVLLVLCMMMSIMPMSVFAADAHDATKPDYVAIGESMTNGFGIPEYYGEGNTDNPYQTWNDLVTNGRNWGYKRNVTDAYPALIAAAMGWNVTQMAISSMRPEDFHWIMNPDYSVFAPEGGADNYSKEDYYIEAAFGIGAHHNGKTIEEAREELRKQYTKAIKEAEYVSLHLGTHCFTSSTAETITSLIGLGGSKPTLESLQAEYNVDEMLEHAGKESMKTDYYTIMNAVDSYMKANLDAALYESLAAPMAHVLAYSTLSFIIHYDECLDIVRDVNPDATLIVISMPNVMYNFKLNMGDYTLDLGDFYGVLLDFLNGYRAGDWDDMSFNNIYVDCEDIDFGIDALARGIDENGNQIYVNDPNYAGANEVFRAAIIQQLKDYAPAEFRSGIALIETYVLEYIAVDDAGKLAVKNRMLSDFSDGQVPDLETYNYLLGVAPDAVAAFAPALNGLDMCNNVYVESMKASKKLLVEGIDGVTFMAALSGGMTDLMGGMLNELMAGQPLSPASEAILYTADRLLIQNGQGIHPSELGHKQVAAAVIKAVNENRTAEKHLLGKLEGIVAGAYAVAYDKAVNAGYVDTAVNYMDTATMARALGQLALLNTEIPADFAATKALLMDEIDNALATVAATKDLLLTADNLDSDTWNAVLAAVATLDSHVETITALVNELTVVAAPYVEAFKAEVAPYVAELETAVAYYSYLAETIAKEAYAYADGKVNEFKQAYAEFVENAGKEADKIDPALGAALRAYLTETPVEVLSILHAYSSEAWNKLLVSAADLSDDLLNVVYAFGAIVANDGYNMILSVVNDGSVEALIAEIYAQNAKLEALVAEMKAAPVTSAMNYQVQIDAIEASIAALYAKAYDVAMNAIAAVDPLKADVLTHAIDALEASLTVAKTDGIAYATWLGEYSKAMAGKLLVVLFENTKDLGEVAANVAIRIAEDALNALAQELTALIEAEIARLQYEIALLAAQIEADLRNELTKVEAEAKAALKAYIEGKVNELMLTLKHIQDAVADYYHDLAHLEYVATPDSYYVSITDTTTLPGIDSYGKLLASELGLDLATQFAQLGLAGLRVEDIRYILDPSFTPDQYGEQFSANIDALRAEFYAAISKADLITIGVNNNTFTLAQINRILTNSDAGAYEMDWGRYTGEALLPVAQFAESKLIEAITKEIGSPEIASMLVTAVESFAYEYISYVFNYAAVLDTIRAINPDAQLVIVGTHNPLDDMTFTDENGNVVKVGEYLNYFVEMTNYYAGIYGMFDDNAMFAKAENVETIFDEMVANGEATASIESYLLYLIANPALFNASQAGHEYIKDCIMNILDTDHVCMGDPATCTEDSVCRKCGALIEAALGHNEKTLKDVAAVPATCTSTGTKAHKECTICGKLFVAGAEVTPESLVIAKTNHTFEWVIDLPAGEGSTGIKHEECSVCGTTRNNGTVIPALTHTHNMTHHEAVAATCVATGNVEYWTCDHASCNGIYYANAEGTDTLNDTIIAIDPNNHVGGTTIVGAKDATESEKGYTGDKVCNSCHTILEQGTETPVVESPVTPEPTPEPTPKTVKTTLIVVGSTAGVSVVAYALFEILKRRRIRR